MADLVERLVATRDRALDDLQREATERARLAARVEKLERERDDARAASEAHAEIQIGLGQLLDERDATIQREREQRERLERALVVAVDALEEASAGIAAESYTERHFALKRIAAARAALAAARTDEEWRGLTQEEVDAAVERGGARRRRLNDAAFGRTDEEGGTVKDDRIHDILAPLFSAAVAQGLHAPFGLDCDRWGREYAEDAVEALAAAADDAGGASGSVR